MISLRESNARLEALAKLLDKLPPARFNYGEWVGTDWGGAKDLSCGTTACALGWASTMPKLRRAGLRLSADGDPACGDDVGSAAANIPLGLSYSESQYLFIPDTWPPNYIDRGPLGPTKGARAKTVAKHIRRFIELRRKYAKQRNNAY